MPGQLLAFAGKAGGWGGGRTDKARFGQRAGAGRAAVRRWCHAPVDSAVVNDRLNAIGNGEAILSVAVTPQATGNLTEVLVNSGDRIEKGQVIARLDSDEQKIAAAQAKVAVDSAREKVERNRRLGNAVAVAVLREAEFAHAGRRTGACRRPNSISNAATSSRRPAASSASSPSIRATMSRPRRRSPSLTIARRSSSISGRRSGSPTKISVGQAVTAIAIALPKAEFSGAIHAIDNRVDQASRTLRVRARIDNPEDTLRAGMSFSVSVRFPGDRYPTVNPLAIQWSAEGSHVWRVKDDKIEQVPITIIQRNSDKVLVDAELAKGEAVVMEGRAAAARRRQRRAEAGRREGEDRNKTAPAADTGTEGL